MQIKADAPVVVRDEIFVAAPIQTVWAVLTDIRSWPRWQPEITRVEMQGPLASGAVFRWRSNGLSITSTVRDLQPPTFIGWTGSAYGIRAVHTWKLTPQQGGVVVHTEESFDGWLVRLLRRWMQRSLDRSIKTWLQSLKLRAESTVDSRRYDSPPVS
jgi:uncharacterized protein YndB with AHSA1/START domain